MRWERRSHIHPVSQVYEENFGGIYRIYEGQNTMYNQVVNDSHGARAVRIVAAKVNPQENGSVSEGVCLRLVILSLPVSAAEQHVNAKEIQRWCLDFYHSTHNERDVESLTLIVNCSSGARTHGW